MLREQFKIKLERNKNSVIRGSTYRKPGSNSIPYANASSYFPSSIVLSKAKSNVFK